jgi:hypothetical protein
MFRAVPITPVVEYLRASTSFCAVVPATKKHIIPAIKMNFFILLFINGLKIRM